MNNSQLRQSVMPEHCKDYHFVTGEKHKYLGRYYTLVVQPIGDGGVQQVALRGEYLYLSTKEPADIAASAGILDAWYQKQAEAVFTPIVAEAVVKAIPYNHKRLPQLRIYRMNNQWGACNPKTGVLILNLELIKVPEACIAFVAQHEVLHLSFPSHNNAFFSALKTLMPNWMEREKTLRTLYPI
ncbi:M48 family metallopeptidase [Pseudoramibacter faecis]|uniref:M48 family metallopeptidase n=1 Tax=Pseudoramibacter faecis TaxID=3108534 RepID=UPI002E798C8C|nr:YgjP-like metallopeptidase domain-containing protein [Pseudoramibacter sp. HA2172]